MCIFLYNQIASITITAMNCHDKTASIYPKVDTEGIAPYNPSKHINNPNTLWTPAFEFYNSATSNLSACLLFIYFFSSHMRTVKLEDQHATCIVSKCNCQKGLCHLKGFISKSLQKNVAMVLNSVSNLIWRSQSQIKRLTWIIFPIKDLNFGHFNSLSTQKIKVINYYY